MMMDSGGAFGKETEIKLKFAIAKPTSHLSYLKVITIVNE